MSESTLQQYLIKKVKELGGLAVKVDCSSRRGWPDIILAMPNREIRLVEVKSDTGRGRLSDHQQSVHAELWELSHQVEVVESRAEVDHLLNN